jgi:hypothetical protein
LLLRLFARFGFGKGDNPIYGGHANMHVMVIERLSLKFWNH